MVSPTEPAGDGATSKEPRTAAQLESMAAGMMRGAVDALGPAAAPPATPAGGPPEHAPERPHRLRKLLWGDL